MECAPKTVKLKNAGGKAANYYLVDVSGSGIRGMLTHTEGAIRDASRFRVLSVFYPMEGDTHGLEEARYDRNTYCLILCEKPIRMAAGILTSFVVNLKGDQVNSIVWE